MAKFIIMRRMRQLVNTDPQRRCYNGCHAASELVWTDWEVFDIRATHEAAERRLIFWDDLSDYAVSARGESARSEYRIDEE